MEEFNELHHHGVKGQKWGVRRYQRKDGSLTPLGRKRAGGSSSDSKGGMFKFKSKQKDKAKAASEKSVSKKKLHEMTDEEITAAIKRTQLENQYRALHPEHVSAGKRFFGSLGKDVIAPAAKNAGKKFLEDALMKGASKLLTGDDDPNTVEALRKTYEKLDLQQKIDRAKNPDKYMSWEERTKKYNLERKMATDAENDKAKTKGKEESTASNTESSNSTKRTFTGYTTAGQTYTSSTPLRARLVQAASTKKHATTGETYVRDHVDADGVIHTRREDD